MFQKSNLLWWNGRLARYLATLPLAFVATAAVPTMAHAADPILKPLNSSYITDTFEDITKSNLTWYYASCNTMPHFNPAGRNYAFFGTAARPGQCIIVREKNAPVGSTPNSYMRFVTMPFDRRDAEVVYDANGNVVSDNYDPVTTIDIRKGGSEMRGNVSRYTYSATKPEGWDNFGVNYLNPDNTVQYSWKFRLSDISILRANSAGTKLATSAVVGQFHSQSSDPCNKTKPYESGFSPSPGLDVSVIPAAGTIPEQVKFELRANLKSSQIPPGGEQCPEGKTQCVTTLWEGTFPTSAIVPQKIPSPDLKDDRNWITVSYVMRNAKDSRGAMRFYFGIEGSSDPVLTFKRRVLAGEDPVTKTLHIPTTQNDCPNVPYLGSYVLGYDRVLYGQDINTTSLTWRIRMNSTWVSPYMTGNTTYKIPPNDLYMSYINGTWPQESPPPQLMVDYDNFTIVQSGKLPAKP